MAHQSPMTVADYIVERLAQVGITECFGVPGDFAFTLDDAIERNPRIKWIGCANELNAAYAADGYARIRGAALLCTTYAVGELSALNGVMGAKAEHSIIFHLVGMPSMRNQHQRKIVHHTLGDGVFQNFNKLSEAACCVSAVITPQNCVSEMERVVATALAKRQPAYILVAEDYALMPVVESKVAPWPQPASHEKQLQKVVQEILDRLNQASKVVVLPAYKLSRINAKKECQQLIEKLNVPFASMAMDKGVISETHPNYIGMYNGNQSSTQVDKIFAEADLILNIGDAYFNELNTVAFDFNLDPNKMITFGLDFVKIGEAFYDPIILKEVLVELTKACKKSFSFKPIQRQSSQALVGKAQDAITAESMYSRLQQFIKPNDVLVVDTGSFVFGLVELQLPENAEFHNQSMWGSIGWATPAAFGTALADQSRRTVLFAGEGSHQLTANEIGSFGRYDVKPVIFVLNNGGYMVERALEEFPDWGYNDLAPWRYHELPKTLGCEGWFTAKVSTNAELDVALEKANSANCACYIEIIGGRMDFPPRMQLMHQRLQQLYGS